MRKLENTLEDKVYLESLLKLGLIKVTVSMGCFTSNLASSLTTVEYKGEVVDLDIDSGYCEVKHEKGHMMPCVNINCIVIN